MRFLNVLCRWGDKHRLGGSGGIKRETRGVMGGGGIKGIPVTADKQGVGQVERGHVTRLEMLFPPFRLRQKNLSRRCIVQQGQQGS